MVLRGECANLVGKLAAIEDQDFGHPIGEGTCLRQSPDREEAVCVM